MSTTPTRTIPPFSVTWDYRCPFARVAHEHLVSALKAGAPFDVSFLAFSLSQAHRGEDDKPIWEEPDTDSGLRALEVGVVVRDRFQERFLDVHGALFSLRHDEGKDLRDEKELGLLLERTGVDPEAVFDEIATGSALERVRQEHETAVVDHKVWGVPTFIVNDQAVFIRLMERPSDAAMAQATVEKLVRLIEEMPELNEFKHTAIER